jgi:hypothetical protein
MPRIFAAVGGRGNDEFDRKLTAAGQGRRRDREHLDAGDALQLAAASRQDLKHGALALVPRFGHHAAEAGGGQGDLER